MPHLGEESERGWGIGVIDRELDAGLQNKIKTVDHDHQNTLQPTPVCLLSITAKLIMLSAANKAVFTFFSLFGLN